MIHVLAAVERNIKNAAEQTYNLKPIEVFAKTSLFELASACLYVLQQPLLFSESQAK